MNRHMAALREHVPRNHVEYAEWEDGEIIPDLSLDQTVPGKYRSTVTNIVSKHGTEIKLLSEDMIQTTSHLSKKKLKDLITKHNNEIFSFMAQPDKTPHILGLAESIFRRYGRENPSIKIQPSASIVNELNVNMSLDKTLIEFNEGLNRNRSNQGIDDFVGKTKWLMSQYKTIGEEVLRLETTLFQKIDQLDKLHQRIPLITNLTHNDALPALIDSFSSYAESVYVSAHFEENYNELMESYKKWNICRQLLSVQQMMRQDGNEPHCSICLTELISYAIVPCGHTFCSGCSKKQNTTCFICRGQIRERMKLYFA